LLADHENIILNLRAMNIVFVGQLKDAGSGDFIARLMEEHEKIAWMLRSQLR
jgi:starvation-inducible DNA-binding protein